MWALLFASLALAQDAALEARLLGPEGPVVGPLPEVVGPAAPPPVVEPIAADPIAEETTATPALSTASFLDQLEQDGAVARAGETTSPGLPWWVPLVALAGAGAFYWTRKKTVTAEPEELPAIQIISRASLGGSAGVVLVDVDDGGRRRRLLLGTGDKQPVLLTELGTHRGLVDEIGSERKPRPAPRTPQRTGLVDEIGSERAVSRRAQGLSKALSSPKKPAAANRPSNDWMAVDPSSELGPRKAAARVLIHQEMNRRTAT